MSTTYDDLVDRNEIAALLGVGPTAVSNYVARTSERHPPFPGAIITRSKGRFRLWDVDDVVAWVGVAFPDRAADLANKDIAAELKALR